MTRDSTLKISTVFVALARSNDEALVEFYRALFAVEPTIHQPNYAEFALPGLRLGIFQPKAEHRQEFAGQAGSISLCLEVNQLEAVMQRLSQLAAPLGEIMVTSHGREMYAYDPAGNRLILHEAMPKL
jgi:predicted enzyme related to lactoylglutathione lyase